MSATSAIVIVLVLAIITLGILAAVAATAHNSTKVKKEPSHTPHPSDEDGRDDSSCKDGLDAAKKVYEKTLNSTTDQIDFMKDLPRRIMFFN